MIAVEIQLPGGPSHQQSIQARMVNSGQTCVCLRRVAEKESKEPPKSGFEDVRSCSFFISLHISLDPGFPQAQRQRK